MQEALRHGLPVILSVRSFPRLKKSSFVTFEPDDLETIRKLEATGGAGLGRHAVCAVGYSDDRSAFRIMNSWGTESHDDGFFWVPYWALATMGPDSDGFVREAYVLLDLADGQTPTREFSLRQSSAPDGESGGRRWYQWQARLDGPVEQLAEVRQVTFHLKPYFNEDLHAAWTVQGWQLGARVFGSFPFQVSIKLADGKVVTLRDEVVLGPPPLPALGMTNTARSTGRGRFDWTVMLTGSEADLQQVDHVVYRLHPTFPDPDRRADGSWSNGFAHSTNGYGEFEIKAEVTLVDGRTMALSHRLDFGRD